ncbi:TnsA endonuclease N-terminal domain-containing protein [Burkholderia ubonensis]|uniref:TnsA endonuclease N-terminal domain-containing protein n=1 Tax=Burkholderia ubonensis TaxID=101571 RepID=UPI0009B49BA9|nr:TnsA endonuclease N-terminal domain-containing protein [Burkholderia ubonensis]
MDWNADPAVYPPYLRPRVRRGLGIGVGASYRPWRQIRRSGIRGTASYVRGVKIDRVYQLLSEKETTYFYLKERQPEVVDIREHWPILDLDRTLQLSQACGINHPMHDGMPEPFALDFLITEQSETGINYRACCLSPMSDSPTKRSEGLLQVQSRWCQENGIAWYWVDISQFDRVILHNLRYIRSWFRHQYCIDEAAADAYAAIFLAAYQRNIPLHMLLAITAQHMHQSETDALDTFLYCAWSGRIPITLTHRLAINAPVVLGRDANDG